MTDVKPRTTRLQAPKSIAALGPVARPQKASELIAENIRERILNGDLAEGSQLPPETQLVHQLGVSRTTVREAFRILETENLISVARGSRSGARVQLPSAATPARYIQQALRAAGATIAESYEAQLAFEPFAVRLLAERASAKVLAELRAGVKALETKLIDADPAEMNVALARFHLLLVQLTGNRTLAITAEMLAMVLEPHQRAHRWTDPAAASDESWQKFRSRGPRSIKKLVDLIESRDADAAEAHWRTHLKNAAAFWLKQKSRSVWR